jgi:hypothetical protein
LKNRDGLTDCMMRLAKDARGQDEYY